ncbi:MULTISPECIES: hypothetical protein [Flavobacterium]|nr:hypothetical protein [Flavobacterium sp. N1846]
MKYLLFSATLLLMISAASCQEKQEMNEPEVLYSLPKSLKEVSGIEWVNNKLWAIEDSGNENELYELDEKGEVIHSVIISNATNTDWEDLASDTEGNIYIGDFGNNDNDRTDLCIYKISKDSLGQEQSQAVSKTTFSYPEQKEFPPKKTERVFDVEAFVVFKDHFYLFTKNRSKNLDGRVALYKIPNKPGNQPAQQIGSFITCPEFNTCAITAADISNDGQKLALLSHNAVWLFENFKEDHFFDGKKTELPLNHYSQKEAITFKSNSALLIADEKIKKSGGKVYEFKLKN